jgi:hypothetical protein
MNKVTVYAIAGGVLVTVACAGLYGAFAYGKSVERAENNARVAAAVEAAKKKQAKDQKSVNDLADQYYQAVEKNVEIASNLNKLKAELRKTRNAPPPECNPFLPPVVPAIYRMFNQATSHPDLPQAVGTRVPDEAGDGLDAVQYCGTEAARLAIKVNALQGVIRQSECF